MPKLPTQYLIPQFMLAHFSHHVSVGVLIPLLPLIREGFGLNYFQSGILVSSFSISYGLGQVPMAILADRFGRRLLIVLGLIGTSLAGIVVSCTQAFWQMVPCFIAMGVFGGTYHAPASSFISQIFPPEKRGQILGMHLIGGSTSFLLTPVMAVGIATLFNSWRAPFFILALPALFVSALLWITTEESQSHDAKHIKISKSIEENNTKKERSINESNQIQISWPQIIHSIGILACLAMAMTVVYSSVNSYLPLYMVDHHNISPKWAGIVISVIAGAGIIGAPLGGGLSDRIGRKQVILFSVSLSGPLLFAAIKSPFGILLLLSLILYGMANSVRTPTIESLIADVVPIGRRTTVLGFYFFLGMETAGIVTPILGHLIDMYGLDPIFTGMALWLCLVAGIAILFRKHI